MLLPYFFSCEVCLSFFFISYKTERNGDFNGEERKKAHSKMRIADEILLQVGKSVLTQSGGYTSGYDWNIKERVRYKPCTEAGSMVLTEPYVDPAGGKVILRQ